MTAAALPALTKNQSLVLHALQGATTPLSAYSLLDQLRDNGFRAPLQVYRALDKLMAFGLVHRLESLNAFVACAGGCETHSHRHGLVAFAICERCSKVEEFSDQAVEDRLTGWSRSSGFKLEKTTIEMRGTCAACLAH
jgi:Fur family transcriptional regulator, zinc uptake regulator